MSEQDVNQPTSPPEEQGETTQPENTENTTGEKLPSVMDAITSETEPPKEEPKTTKKAPSRGFVGVRKKSTETKSRGLNAIFCCLLVCLLIILPKT